MRLTTAQDMGIDPASARVKATMRLLSLETATDRGAFALWAGSVTATGLQTDTCVSYNCPVGQTHAETLLPALRQTLAELEWPLASIDALVLDSGPGMFTGLRVSAALAQGLAVALDKPVVTVSSLEVLAEATHRVTGATTVVSLLDARMNQVYAGSWHRAGHEWHPGSDMRLVNPDQLAVFDASLQNAFAAGTALDEYPQVSEWVRAQGLVDGGVRYPTAEALARLGAIRCSLGQVIDPAEALPVYVRDRVALTTAERAAGAVL